MLCQLVSSSHIITVFPFPRDKNDKQWHKEREPSGCVMSWNNDLLAGSARAFPGEHSSWAKASRDKLCSFANGVGRRNSKRCTCWRHVGVQRPGKQEIYGDIMGGMILMKFTGIEGEYHRHSPTILGPYQGFFMLLLTIPYNIIMGHGMNIHQTWQLEIPWKVGENLRENPTKRISFGCHVWLLKGNHHSSLLITINHQVNCSHLLERWRGPDSLHMREEAS